MDELLDIAYQNHPKSQKLKPLGKIIIECLREKDRTVDELARALSLDITIPAHKKRLYNLLRPLKNKGMIQNRRTGGKTYYYLSYDGFRFFLDRLRKTGEYWLKRKDHSS
jgi:DNA-binding transcriptional ArsR family regulator